MKSEPSKPIMSSDQNKENAHKTGRRAGDGDAPEWANGLRQLYDSVVDEPLPDTFKDLLEQFDDSDETANHKSDRKQANPSSHGGTNS